jgi:hypothetical protein
MWRICTEPCYLQKDYFSSVTIIKMNTITSKFLQVLVAAVKAPDILTKSSGIESDDRGPLIGLQTLRCQRRRLGIVENLRIIFY